MLRLILLSLFGLLPYSDYAWVQENIRTSYQLEFVMMSYTYRKDTQESEQWEDLTDALRRKAFDCEEAGMLAYNVLTGSGYQCKIYIVWGSTSAHVITSYSKAKDVGYFSNCRRYPDRDFTVEKYIIQSTKYTEWIDITIPVINYYK